MRRTFALAGLVLLLSGGCEHRAEFPIASVAAIPALFDATDWEQVDTLGNREGPFKSLGDHVLNAGAKKRVWYTERGSRVEKDLAADDVEILIRRFENRRGDALVLVYKRRPAAG